MMIQPLWAARRQRSVLGLKLGHAAG